MPKRVFRSDTGVPERIREGVADLSARLGVPEHFPDEVVACAKANVANVVLPELDYTHIPFVTIDPPGAKDLDQALFIERAGDGFDVWYAIADVASWVHPGDAVDLEAHARGQTFYAPGTRASLHPPVMSENAASLLVSPTPRPAAVWKMHVEPDGKMSDATVTRALVRNRAQLDYAEVQTMLREGSASESLQLLRVVGKLREEREIARGGVSLPLPEQEIHSDGERWRLSYRASLPIESWNAQISLMTGMAAAAIMLDAGVGVLRTLPPADPPALRRLRQTAHALRISWPKKMAYPDFVRSLEPEEQSHQAMLNACTMLFRGAGYTSFTEGRPEGDLRHNALAMNYAHTTAPLRRLVDRYVLEVCLAVCAGQEVPEWVIEALPDLPETMAESDRRAKAYERGLISLTEAAVLCTETGKEFTGTVIEARPEKDDGELMLAEPAVIAKVEGDDLPYGEEIRVKLIEANPRTGVVRFRAPCAGYGSIGHVHWLRRQVTYTNHWTSRPGDRGES
ncbi:MAG: ribonuclease II [Propionibacteriales bacterium]|nr:MAG: ribonuclease II [Propionibacteriales bacterium]